MMASAIPTPTATLVSRGATARQNLGPLTTTWVPPTDCMNVIGTTGLLDQGWQGQSCESNGVPVDVATCWPPTTSGAVADTSATPFLGRGFYSPGVACPSGYSQACSKTAGTRAVFEFQYGLEAGQTAVGCCPTGYTCGWGGNKRNAQTCILTATKSTSILVGTCPSSSGDSVNFHYQAVPLTTTTNDRGNPRLITISSFTVWAPMFQLVHQVTDVLTASQTAASSSMVGFPAPGSNSQPWPLPDDGPPLLVKVAIGVGSSVAFLIIMILSFCLWRAKRRAARAAKYNSDKKLPPARKSDISVPIVPHVYTTKPPMPPPPRPLRPPEPAAMISPAGFSSPVPGTRRAPTAYTVSPVQTTSLQQYQPVYNTTLAQNRPPTYGSYDSQGSFLHAGSSTPLSATYQDHRYGRDNHKKHPWPPVVEVNPHQPAELV